MTELIRQERRIKELGEMVERRRKQGLPVEALEAFYLDLLKHYTVLMGETA